MIVDVAESALIAAVVVILGEPERIRTGDMGENPMVLHLLNLQQNHPPFVFLHPRRQLAACRKCMCIFKSTAKLCIFTNCRISMRPLELFLALF